MAEMTFREETDAWMKELGYGLHMHSGDGTMLSYSVNDINLVEHAPGIQVYEQNGRRWCQLFGTGLKLFLTIQSGELSYKHPEIQKWIDVMTHYSQVCTHFPPQLNKT